MQEDIKTNKIMVLSKDIKRLIPQHKPWTEALNYPKILFCGCNNLPYYNHALSPEHGFKRLYHTPILVLDMTKNYPFFIKND